jgi:hypothetical protein
MATELTREELFEQVWKRPMTKVAAGFGISDVALKKICDKHRVPVPGRGYWAKKAAGKKVQRAHFRAVTDAAISRIIIHGSPAQRLPEAVREARLAAKMRERRPENRIQVVAPPQDLHSAVARTGNKLERAKPSQRGLVATSGADLFDLEIGRESVGRVVAFLNALVIAAEERSYRVVKGNRAQTFLVDDELLSLKLVEQTTRSKHSPTEAELAAIQKWERRQQRRYGGWGYGEWTPRPTPPEWDYTPNGQLQVIVNERCYGHNGLRRTFGDGKTQRIESLINAILEGFATWSAAIKAKRIEDERRRREWEEQERRREEQRRRNALESKRVEGLAKDLERWRQRQQILGYVAAVEAKLNADNCVDEEAVRQWINWAKDYADRIDPLHERLPHLLHFEEFKPWELSY